jgi:hypothetical protein
MANINEKKHYHFIYKTTNLINGKYYFGMHSTSNLKDGYLGSGKHLRYSIRKYGKSNFKCEILEFLPDRLSLIAREKELITEEMISNPICMNISYGGLGGFQNEEHEKKFRIASLANYKEALETARKKQKWLRENDKEWYNREALNNSIRLKGNVSWTGKHHTDKSKQKIGQTNSIHQKGNGNSQFGTCWITNGTENKKIKKNDTIPEGWYVGRCIHSDSNCIQNGINHPSYGYHWITNGIKDRKIKKEELVPENWRYGRSLIGNVGKNQYSSLSKKGLEALS